MTAILCDRSAHLAFCSGTPLFVVGPEEQSWALREGRADTAGATMVSQSRLMEPMEALDARLRGHSPCETFLLVDSHSKAHRARGVRPRIFGGAPSGSLMRIWPDRTPSNRWEEERSLYTVSPELHLLMATRRLDETRLSLLAMALCGSYLPRPDLERGFVECRPLTSPERTAAFLERCAAERGSRRLARTMAHVGAPCASPEEAACIALLCLPRRLGGRGLPVPEANGVVVVGRTGSTLLGGRDSIRPDLLWREQGVAVEYDSTGSHVGDASGHRDRMRRLAAESAGVKVRQLTADILYDTTAMGVFCDRLAEDLGVTPRPPDAEAHDLLREVALGPHDFW